MSSPEGDDTQYNSAALRILLLEGKTALADWQIGKALRSAIQKRGYGRVPWSGREEKRDGKTEEDREKEMAKKDRNIERPLRRGRDSSKGCPPSIIFPVTTMRPKWAYGASLIRRGERTHRLPRAQHAPRPL